MEVIVYTKPGCVQCKSTTSMMDRRGVRYDPVDISNRPDLVEWLQADGRKSLPVVVAGDPIAPVVWEGFRPDLIAKL